MKITLDIIPYKKYPYELFTFLTNGIMEVTSEGKLKSILDFTADFNLRFFTREGVPNTNNDCIIFFKTETELIIRLNFNYHDTTNKTHLDQYRSLNDLIEKVNKPPSNEIIDNLIKKMKLNDNR